MDQVLDDVASFRGPQAEPECGHACELELAVDRLGRNRGILSGQPGLEVRPFPGSVRFTDKPARWLGGLPGRVVARRAWVGMAASLGVTGSTAWSR